MAKETVRMTAREIVESRLTRLAKIEEKGGKIQRTTMLYAFIDAVMTPAE